MGDEFLDAAMKLLGLDEPNAFAVSVAAALRDAYARGRSEGAEQARAEEREACAKTAEACALYVAEQALGNDVGTEVKERADLMADTLRVAAKTIRARGDR